MRAEISVEVPSAASTFAGKLQMRVPMLASSSATVGLCTASLIGVQPHVFAWPPPPHHVVPEQLGQTRVPPHASGIDPHWAPAAWQVVFVHPHTLAVPPPPQLWGVTQLLGH